MEALRLKLMCGALAFAVGLTACGVKGPPRPPKAQPAAVHATDEEKAAPDQPAPEGDGGVGGD